MSNFANEDFESPLEVMDSGTWLLWSDAGAGTQHIHILARCLVCPGFCQHSPTSIVHFQQSAGFEHTTQMAATNPNKTWRVESPWENMRKHNNMSLWSYSTLVRRSPVTRSCDLLWVLEDTLGRLLYDVTVLYHTFVRHSWDWRLLWDTFARCSSDSRRHDWQTMA